MSIIRVDKFILPDNLCYLCEIGWWPSSEADLYHQDTDFLVSSEIVQSVFNNLEIRRVCFEPIENLVTIEKEIEDGDSFWLGDFVEKFNPSRSISIGDFGYGSDSAIILFYEEGTENPSVHFLDWDHLQTSDGYIVSTKWKKVADSFNEFCIKLDIPNRY